MGGKSERIEDALLESESLVHLGTSRRGVLSGQGHLALIGGRYDQQAAESSGEGDYLSAE